MKIIQIAGYKFVNLADTEALRTVIYRHCDELALKGTVLLSREGINFNLAGLAEDISVFLAFVQSDRRFADIPFRKSASPYQPFRRLKVKLKREIITMNMPGIHPEMERAPTISPQQLKHWLDEKRKIILLDVRNDFEVKAGTFDNAISLNLNAFSEFPRAAATLFDTIKSKPVVTFCTGGIRCEKAALFLLYQGCSEVYQLDGGILNYFEYCGSAHYHGECFVFDQRISLNHKLKETGEAFSTPVRPDSHISVIGSTRPSRRISEEPQSR